MKKIILSIIAVASLGSASAQCTVSISDTIYCLNDSSVAATVDTTGGSWSGLGLDSNGVFNPSLSGAGVFGVNYLLPSNTGIYNIDSTGAFNPMTGTGTTVSLSDDALSGILPIGFSFSFYSVAYTDFYISSNGFITFTAGSSNGCCTGGNLPNNGNPNNLIAFAWEDLNPSSAGTIEYFTVGAAPNRRLIMNFLAVPHFGSSTNDVTVQVQLHETTNRIEIHTTAMPSDGGGHTMGIENNPGDTASVFPGRNSTGTWSLTNDYTAFYLGIACATAMVEVLPAPSPVTIAPAGPTTLCPGQSTTIVSNFWGDSLNTLVWSTGDSAIYYTNVSSSDSITASVADTNGCYALNSNMIVIVQDSCVSVEEIAVEIASFYPNPVTGMLNIQFEDNFNREIKISDSFGKLIYSEKLSDKKVSIDLHNYPVGMYLVNVISSKGIISRKIIKQ